MGIQIPGFLVEADMIQYIPKSQAGPETRWYRRLFLQHQEEAWRLFLEWQQQGFDWVRFTPSHLRVP